MLLLFWLKNVPEHESYRLVAIQRDVEAGHPGVHFGEAQLAIVILHLEADEDDGR